MAQIARNLMDRIDGFFKGRRYLIHDRDPLYTQDFLNLLAEAGIDSAKLPPRSPNLNAYAERFVRSIKESCLKWMIFFSEDSLRNAIREFVAIVYGGVYGPSIWLGGDPRVSEDAKPRHHSARTTILFS